MTVEMILVGAAILCVIGIVGFSTLALIYRKEETVAFISVIAAITCLLIACGCVNEVVNRLDKQVEPKSKEPKDGK
jgi:hypothetical protein